VFPLTLTGKTLYTHLAIKKLLTAHTQSAMPRDTVTKRVGMRRSSAMPVQKSEKRRAVMRESASVPATKEKKRRSGVRERRNWMLRKAWFLKLAWLGY
jgi:hypothetical protein